jgi:hypothetical protein
MVAGAATVVVGSFLPWAKVNLGALSVSINGTEGDGVLTLILGALFGAFGIVALKRQRHTLAVVMGLIGSGLALAIGIYDIADINNVADDLEGGGEFLRVSTGFGLYLVIAGAVAGVAGSLIKRSESSGSVAQPPAPPAPPGPPPGITPPGS